MKLSSLMDSKHVRAKNSNGTSVGTFAKFNLLRGRCTLLLSLPLLTSLSAPGYTCTLFAKAQLLRHKLMIVKLKSANLNFANIKT